MEVRRLRQAAQTPLKPQPTRPIDDPRGKPQPACPVEDEAFADEAFADEAFADEAFADDPFATNGLASSTPPLAPENDAFGDDSIWDASASFE